MCDRTESDDRTNTVARDDSFKVPFCDGLDVPLHSPRGRITGSGVLSSEHYDKTPYSLSFPPDHASCLCTYDHGLRAMVKKEKVVLLDFEY